MAEKSKRLSRILWNGVFNLGDRKVGSIMTHRSELIWLDLTDSIEEIREKVQAHLFNIYPVANGKFDDISGCGLLERFVRPYRRSRILVDAGSFDRLSLCLKTKACTMRWNSLSRPGYSMVL